MTTQFGETFEYVEADKVYDVMLVEYENTVRVIAMNTKNRFGSLEGESTKLVLESSAHILYRIKQ